MDREGPYLPIDTKINFIGGSVWKIWGGVVITPPPLVRSVTKNSLVRRGIKEHDISYLDTKNEISLKMFIVFISFRRQFGAPEVFFPWAPSLRLKLYGAPLVMLTYLFFFLAPSFFHLFFPLFSSFFFLSFFSSLSVSFPFLFSFFLAPPLVTPEGPSPKAPEDTPLPLCSLYPPVSLCLLFFFALSSRKFQHI